MKKLLVVFITLFPIILFAQTEYPIETVLQKGHSNHVVCVAFSPDGKFLATGSYDNTIKLWEVSSGKEIRTYNHHTGTIRSLQFSKNGENILSSAQDNYACIFNISTATVIQTCKLPKDRMAQAVYSPLENYIIVKDYSSSIYLFRANTGTLVSQYKTPHNQLVYSQIMSADESSILEYQSYKNVQVVSIATKDTLLTIPFYKAQSLSFSPDGKTIAVGSSKLYAKIFNSLTGEELQHLEYSTEIRCDGCNTKVRYSNNGKKIITAASRSGVNVWNVANGKLIHNLVLNDERYSAIGFSNNDEYVFAQKDDNTYVWDVNTGVQLFTCNNNGLDYTPAFSKQNTLAVASKYNTATIWSVSQKRVVKKLHGYMNTARTDGLNFKQSNWTDLAVLAALRTKPATCLSPNGQQLVKGKIDSIAIILNVQTGQVLHQLKGHSKQVITCKYSPDGKLIATAGGDGDIRFWDAQTGMLVSVIDAHYGVIFDIAFSADGTQILSASWDGYYSLWDVATGKHIRTTDIKNSSPFRIQFTPKDLYIMAADISDNYTIWEADSGEEFRKLIGHTEVVYDFDFSPSGQQFVSASKDGKVKVWDMLTGMQTNKFSQSKSSVNAVCWDPKNRYIATGGNDRNIYLLNAQTVELEHKLIVSSGAIAGLEFSQDGSILLATTVDGVLHMYEMDSLKELYTYIQIDRNSWLSKTPSGHFDGSAQAIQHINYVSGLKVIQVSSLFEQFFSPKLIQRVMAGEQFVSANKDLLRNMQQAPTVAISISQNGTRGEVNLQDSVEWFQELMPLDVNITDQGGGFEELRVYNNSKLVQNKTYEKTKVKRGANTSTTIQIQLTPGENNLQIVAINKNRVESAPIEITVFFDGVEADVDLYMFVIGIDDYDNPAYKLSYATKDAKACLKEMDKGAMPIFKNIYTTVLKDKEASKLSITEQFSKIATQAGPEDVFLLYYAGHGTMSMGNADESGTFYIVPHDVTKLYGDDELLAEKAVSAKELLEFSKLIQARKQIFILDACQSGGALEAIGVRGASREKAIAQLARSSGTYFILASGAVQFASEAKELGHGLFTYAVLEAIQGKADGSTLDKKITANELKSYVEDRVPELTEKYMLTPQYPTGYSFGQDFPLVVVK